MAQQANYVLFAAVLGLSSAHCLSLNDQHASVRSSGGSSNPDGKPGGSASTAGSSSGGGEVSLGGSSAGEANSSGSSSAAGSSGGAAPNGGAGSHGGKPAGGAGEASVSGGAGVDTGGDGAGGEEPGGEPRCGPNPALTFAENFDSYSAGPLKDVSSSWQRAAQGRTGNVGAIWPHSGSQAFVIDSFTTSTEVHYAALGLPFQPSTLEVSFWYAPDGFYVYEDFATIGLATVASLYDITPGFSVRGLGHAVIVETHGVQTTVFNELPYNKMGDAAAYSYFRLVFDFCQSEVKVYVGSDTSAPLRGTVPFRPGLAFDAIYVSGGLNPTYFDDISVQTP